MAAEVLIVKNGLGREYHHRPNTTAAAAVPIDATSQREGCGVRDVCSATAYLTVLAEMGCS